MAGKDYFVPNRWFSYVSVASVLFMMVTSKCTASFKIFKVRILGI